MSINFVKQYEGKRSNHISVSIKYAPFEMDKTLKYILSKYGKVYDRKKNAIGLLNRTRTAQNQIENTTPLL